MIMNKIIDILQGILSSYFAQWEQIDILIAEKYFESVENIFAFLFYILPVQGLTSIFALFVSLMFLRIIIAFIKTIWDLLPVL